ncbi:hypothetical protein JJL45_09175 [Tamlana sp. s12]|uniref:hypothetical protein n=1 Tax=Tamlana sp. s12 TaxID=1630406 RepID=UPI0007FFB8B0|nr:hypothetical protein [Tamlana sp. s12]OBQ52873.1 hypothetical protein VQ01_13070 [Tamlana sp. s12]QQY81101.1 hypothetical protein JJL45_09175 [Tamlana sp. s12]
MRDGYKGLGVYKNVSDKSEEIPPITPNLQKVTDSGNYTDRIVEVQGVKFNEMNNNISGLDIIPNWSTSDLPVSVIETMSYDSSGNLYLCGKNPREIYKVTPTGDVSLFAVLGSTPVAIIIRDDVLYVTGGGTNVYRIDLFGNVSILSTPVSNQSYYSLMDSLGNIYFMPYFNSEAIYKMDLEENITLFFEDENLLGTTIYPAIDSNDNLYIISYPASTPYYNILKITQAGELSEYAQTGGEKPFFLVFDEDDVMYALEGHYDKRLSKITPDGTVTILHTFSIPPEYMVYYENKLYILTSIYADSFYNFYEVTKEGDVTLLYTGEGQAYAFQIKGDDIYIANRTSRRVDKISKKKQHILTLDEIGNVIKEINISVAKNGVASTPNAKPENITNGKDLVTVEKLNIILKEILDNKAGKVTYYTTVIGDGSSTSYTITHNLNTEYILHIKAKDVNTNEIVNPTQIELDKNTLSLSFDIAPTADQYEISIAAVNAYTS